MQLAYTGVCAIKALARLLHEPGLVLRVPGVQCSSSLLHSPLLAQAWLASAGLYGYCESVTPDGAHAPAAARAGRAGPITAARLPSCMHTACVLNPLPAGVDESQDCNGPYSGVAALVSTATPARVLSPAQLPALGS